LRQIERLILKNKLLEKIKAGHIASMMSVRLVKSAEISLIASSFGFDALYVDLEHSTFSIDDTSRVCLSAIGAGLTPLVRVPVVDSDYISRVLDSGAMGIIAPHISSVEEAERLVSLCKFPPIGSRSSVTSLPQFSYLSMDQKVLYQAGNSATAVIAMIEDQASITQIRKILAVEGLDGVLIGTNDLCADLGIQGKPDNALIDDAFHTATSAAKEFGKFVGIGGLARNSELQKRYIKMGAHLISLGTDLSFLMDGAKKQIDSVKKII
jgi:2-keto-3-deoxy-L-rhamnonate aldolase RhmA